LASTVLSLLIPILPSTGWTTDIQKAVLPANIKNNQIAISQNAFEQVVFNNITKQSDFSKNRNNSINFVSIILVFYFLGLGFMAFRLISSFYEIFILIKNNIRIPFGKYVLVELDSNYATFSFFRYIFLSEKKLNENDRNDILLHEESHIKQGHSFDIIFIEICKILFWFNPIIWQFKNSLVKVHECSVDEYVIGLRSGNMQNYQSLLLNQYISNFKIELAHPFNYSLIKFRINMLTKTKSKDGAKYKLLFAIPIIILSLVAFTNYHGNLSKASMYIIGSSQGIKLPNGWSWNGLDRSGYKTGIDPQASQHGHKSAFIESVVKNPNNFCTLMQECIIKDFKGKRIKMTGYIKSQGLNDTATMWVRVDDCDKKMSTEFDNMMTRPIIGTKDWTKCEIVFDVADRCAIFFGFIFQGAGKIWVDNVSFTIVGASVNKTTHNLNEPFPSQYLEQIDHYPKNTDLPEKPTVNLDFEE
jgi:BlaR1 peptidase M56